MNDPKILWEDVNIALWSDGALTIHEFVMGSQRCVEQYKPEEVRELYDALRKYYGDDK